MIYTGPTGGAIRSSSKATVLRCSRLGPIGLPWMEAVAVASWSGDGSGDFLLSDYDYPARVGGSRTNLRIKILSTTDGMGGPSDYVDDEAPFPMPFSEYYFSKAVANIPEHWFPHYESKLRIHGPVDGTLISYPPCAFDASSDMFSTVSFYGGSGDDTWINAGSPVMPTAAVYHNLAAGESLEFAVAPSTPTGDTTVSMMVFRLYKHPEDFAWYPL